jgi:hypothetical protein
VGTGNAAPHYQGKYWDQVSAIKIYRREVCIFIRKYLCFSKISISCQRKDQDLEICAIALETKSSKLIILSLYRAPTRDLNQCIQNQDDALKNLHKSKAEFLICGNIHPDLLIESN